MSLVVISFLEISPLLIVSLPIALGNSYSEFLTTTLPQLCPYSTFCTMDSTRAFRNKKKAPCCQPCSCDKECLVFGTCCPDYSAVLKAASPMSPIAQCAAPVHFSFDGFMKDFSQTSGLSFHYITNTCPEEYKVQQIINKCVQPNELSLRHRVVVSDDTGRVYFNRYCAQCNGVYEFTDWNLKQICNEYSNGLTNTSDLQALNDNSCLVVSTPPNTEISSLSKCHPSAVSSCNVTGRWRSFDSDILRACESTSFQYIKETFHGFTMYRNPYCYICNEDVGYDVRGVCNPFGIRQPRGPMNARFSGVLGRIPQEAQGDKRCVQIDVYDDRFEKCRTLNCPITNIPNHGTCHEAYATTEKLTVLVQIDVTPADDTTRQRLANLVADIGRFSTTVESLASIITSDVGIYKISCGRCQGTVYFQANGSFSVITIPVSTNGICSIGRLLEMLKKASMRKRHDSLTIGREEFAFSTQLGYSVDSSISPSLFTKFSGMVHVFESSGMCGIHIFLKPLFYCAYVELNGAEYDDLMMSNDNTVRRADFNLVTNTDETSIKTTHTYRICVNNYFVTKSATDKPTV